MVIKTNTKELREMRKITVELLLANNKDDCPTCDKSTTCKLRKLANQLGIEKVRFKSTHTLQELDFSSDAVVRDPNKCVSCGDCIRYCAEIQTVGAIDFAGRGSDVKVLPAFGKNMGDVECVNCGQCARVCPTGALTIKSETQKVWDYIDDKNLTVVAQIAPAVRVAIGESFGLPCEEDLTGKIAAALKIIGFDKIFDTSFTADMTILEEATEFIKRKTKGEILPLFTSCCPAWVKFAEQYYPELLDNLSTCKSPQQMFGSVSKNDLPEILKKEKKQIKVVSIMPCTAKKFEAKRPEFSKDGIQDVDAVITTQELIKMIKEAGIDFNKLEPESLDMPFGFKTGAGVIFANSGGVSEAALRYAYEKITGKEIPHYEIKEVRGVEGLREAEIGIGDLKLKLAVVHGLANARTLCEEVKLGKSKYDIIEVMTCPRGCIGGAGQPVFEDMKVLEKRTNAIYNVDKKMELHKSQENYALKEYYEKSLKEPNSHKAHELLHTHYNARKRMESDSIELMGQADKAKTKVDVCIGTYCFLKGSQKILSDVAEYIEQNNLYDKVSLNATFCTENCRKGPGVSVNDTKFFGANSEMIMKALDKEVK